MTALRLAYGFQSWTTAIHLERALRRVVDVTTEGPGHADLEPSDRAVPVLWIESGISWVPSASHLEGAASAAYLIDTHRGFRWRAALARAFDCTYTAQLPAADRLRRSGIDAEWLPLAAPRELCAPGPELADRPYDVAFVGQAQPGSFRAELMDALRKRVSVAPVAGRLEPAEMMDVYRSARVVINVPLNNDLNMRAFEAPGARSLMVTEHVPGLDRVLPTDAYVTVKERNVGAWTEAVARVLADPNVQARADAAHHVVLEEHTYDDRASVVLERLQGLTRRTITPNERRRALAAAWARWHDAAAVRSLELPLPTSLAYQGAALAWGVANRAVQVRRRNSR